VPKIEKRLQTQNENFSKSIFCEDFFNLHKNLFLKYAGFSNPIFPLAITKKKQPQGIKRRLLFLIKINYQKVG
jgi:hypothetical protein